MGLCGEAGVAVSLQAGRKEGLRVHFPADERQLLFPRQLLDQRLEPCGGRVILRLPESRERLRRPYLFPCAGKDRGEKGAWMRLVLSASEFRREPIFQASFHTIVTLRASYYAPPDMRGSNL